VTLILQIAAGIVLGNFVLGAINAFSTWVEVDGWRDVAGSIFRGIMILFWIALVLVLVGSGLLNLL
jgi:hypothetical protein